MKYKALITRKFVEYKRFFPLVIFSAVILIFAFKIGYVSDGTLIKIENDKFQSIKVKSLFTDKLIDLNQLGQKYVILHFFSPTCSKCLAEIPELQKIKKANIMLIGIAVDDDKENVKNWLTVHGNYFSDVGVMHVFEAASVGINNFPETVIIYTDKQLMYKFQGATTLNAIARITQ